MPYSEVEHVFNIEMGITNVWTDIDFYAEKREHPTQKPLALIKRIIAASTNPGMTVLDPFLGSGTTAVACQQMGRVCVGMEKDTDYIEAARNRLKEATA